MRQKISSTLRSPKILLVLTSLAVLLVSFAHHDNVPVYDGLGFPDEAYRYVLQPADTKATKPPATISQPVDAKALGNSYGIFVQSSESGPQVSVRLGRNSVTLPQDASTIKIMAKPQSPENQPRTRDIVGNVYKLLISTDKGVVVFPHEDNKPKLSYILLRLPQGYAANTAVISYRPADGNWQKLPTARYGNDIYKADLKGNGYYTLIKTKGSAEEMTKRIVIAAGLVLIAAPITIIIAIRRKGTKKPNSR